MYIDPTQPECCFVFRSEKKSKKWVLKFFIDFWNVADENGSIAWSINDEKISILYYFNSKNLDLDYILSTLNSMAREQWLDRMGWKLPFRMQVSNAESWNYDVILNK